MPDLIRHPEAIIVLSPGFPGPRIAVQGRQAGE